MGFEIIIQNLSNADLNILPGTGWSFPQATDAGVGFIVETVPGTPMSKGREGRFLVRRLSSDDYILYRI